MKSRPFRCSWNCSILLGTTVTIDAMGCQKEIAAKIVAGHGDYLLALKENHPTLHEAVCQEFTAALEADIKDNIRGKRFRACLSTDTRERILRSFIEN